MKTQQFKATIEGLSPLLIHAFNINAEDSGSTRKALKQPKTPREEAEEVCHRDPRTSRSSSRPSGSRAPSPRPARA